MKRLLISIARAFIHALLYPLELFLQARGSHRKPPPVFIIGPPRSGTSLLYELLVTRYHFAYISNLAHRFYLTPLAASWLGRSIIGKWHGNFTSRYGHIAGWGAPNEGGWVWRRWLSDGDWTDGADFPDSDAEQLRELSEGLSGIFAAPFLNKNVMHSNRLRLMQKIWPDALYILVSREFTDNARSITRAERKEGGPAHDGDHWWSVRPKLAIDFIGHSDVDRAVVQVSGVHQDIANDIKAIGADRMLTVNYAELCSDCSAGLDDIESFLARHDVKLQQRGDIPAKFETRVSLPMDDAEEARIAELLKTLVN